MPLLPYRYSRKEWIDSERDFGGVGAESALLELYFQWFKNGLERFDTIIVGASEWVGWNVGWVPKDQIFYG